MVASKLPCTDEAKEVLRLVKAAAARGDLTIVGHAWKRMHERGAQREDLESAVASATNATPANDGRWRLLGGVDAEGDELDVVVDIEWEPIRVVTIM